MRNNLAFNGVGERRDSHKKITMIVEMAVTVSWPDGITCEEERCREIAAGVAPQYFEIDVGPGGKIVWASVFCEASTEDVIIDEIIENK